MEIIRIDNLSKKYKDTLAVDGLSLSIEKGELFSLLGVNGAGKDDHDQDAVVPYNAYGR